MPRRLDFGDDDTDGGGDGALSSTGGGPRGVGGGVSKLMMSKMIKDYLMEKKMKMYRPSSECRSRRKSGRTRLGPV